MIWTLLPGAVFLADGCLKKKAEEELNENEQIPVCKAVSYTHLRAHET